MKNILGIQTPAEGQAAELKSDYGLKNHGLINLRKVYWNLPTEALYEEATFRGEGQISASGPLVVNSGRHTARAAADKFVVVNPITEDVAWWGEHNKPFSSAKFEELVNRLQGYLQGRDLFVQDLIAGADPNYRLPIRVVTEYAWHSLFVRNMFIKPDSVEAYRRHVPEFTIICAADFRAFESMDTTRSDTFIVLDFERRLCVIGGTSYGGEMKKAVFTLLNFLLPNQGVLSMHCSANVDDEGKSALFFGLSGTGKTTLSADPTRRLIGDDEHGWSDEGIFNFEDGCYAKVIGLSRSAEPQIYATTERFGTLLENVVYDPVTRRLDLDDDEITENTRASYPLAFIENALSEKMGAHPQNIVLLTCDASGVMPPIARLNPAQAIYQFISGYTAKVGGTEIGLGEEPEIAFSACFGAPFMVHHPARYAELLRRKIERHDVSCWLLNTGWVGGPYGVGKRISIRHTRAMLAAALDGSLQQVDYRKDPVFGFEVPLSCPNVPDELLDPASSWPSEADFRARYNSLARRFIDNFKRFSAEAPEDVRAAGPRV